MALLLVFPLTLGFVSCGDDDNTDNITNAVYVSKSGHKIHKSPTCSGMKYYIVMDYDEAIDRGYSKCSKCY